MAWNSSFFIILASLYFKDLAIAKNPCKTGVSVPGMALKGFVFKKVPVTAPHVCDVTCERETICQSYNYVIGEKSCELNTRTKEARPENFQPDGLRFYMGRISGRTPLGSIPELPALSCQEIKLSEGKDSISKNYWLDPTNVGSSKLVYCDMILEADPCYHYKNLSEASRKINYSTPLGSASCDYQLPFGWYRFVGAAGTKMPTTRVPAYKCGTNWSGWLDGSHPTVEDGEVPRKVCFSGRSTGCRYSTNIFVKNCGSNFIYELKRPPGCALRYCSTD
ncbi:unnamed protein product [Pocillopora meandrina]|uniref:Apple domain-containing protein n=1 Tax=Pocillopora meandrina TaxID=46732 RepID=A0AAU9XAH0_9CNID|nr:unnamed protein product [Pocillopora meandrina]